MCVCVWGGGGGGGEAGRRKKQNTKHFKIVSLFAQLTQLTVPLFLFSSNVVVVRVGVGGGGGGTEGGCRSWIIAHLCPD